MCFFYLLFIYFIYHLIFGLCSFSFFFLTLPAVRISFSTVLIKHIHILIL